MSVKRMISGVVAAAMMLTMQSFAYAEETTFSTVNEFITDVINVSLSGITSSTMDDAMSAMNSKLSISDGVVSYNGSQIGYWESSNSSTLYSDSSKEDSLIQSAGDGYNIKPSLLKTLLSDVNNQLIENYVPTSDDWSKIIGKYDVTLGSVTIPADQWIETGDSGNSISSSNVVNISQLSGITASNATDCCTTNDISIMSWMVDSTGELYLSNALGNVCLNSNGYWFGTAYPLTSIATPSYSSVSNVVANSIPYIKAGLVIESDNMLGPRIWAANIANSNYGPVGALTSSSSNGIMYRVTDGSTRYTGSVSSAKKYGIVYITGSQMGATTISNYISIHNNMFTSNSCSKLVRGNTLITKRIAKLDSISPSEFLTIKNSGWYVTDGSSIDALIGNQNIISAGDTADINAVAEVESLSFNVIVPTTLPVYMDSAGVITTATNATVTNKSNASVKMTDITITAKGESGWTLVQGTPSTVRDAMEFSFTTSLEKDTVLTKDEILPFSYHAELSPLTVGADNLDLATVSVTVDWAD